jgi:hypothetical protein
LRQNMSMLRRLSRVVISARPARIVVADIQHGCFRLGDRAAG